MNRARHQTGRASRSRRNMPRPGLVSIRRRERRVEIEISEVETVKSTAFIGPGL